MEIISKILQQTTSKNVSPNSPQEHPVCLSKTVLNDITKNSNSLFRSIQRSLQETHEINTRCKSSVNFSFLGRCKKCCRYSLKGDHSFRKTRRSIIQRKRKQLFECEIKTKTIGQDFILDFCTKSGVNLIVKKKKNQCIHIRQVHRKSVKKYSQKSKEYSCKETIEDFDCELSRLIRPLSLQEIPDAVVFSNTTKADTLKTSSETFFDSLSTYLNYVLEDQSYLTMPELCPIINRNTMDRLNTENLVSSLNFKHDIFLDPELCVELSNHHFYYKESIFCAEKEKKYWSLLKSDFEFLQGFLGETVTDPLLCIEHGLEVQPCFLRIILLVFEIGAVLTDMCDDDGINDQISIYLDPESIFSSLAHKKSVCFGNFFEGLALLMKKICAPIRDEIIDHLGQNSPEDEESCLECFQECYRILKIMKLDVVNDYIRRYRNLVLPTCIAFERNYFRSRYLSFTLTKPFFMKLHSENRTAAKDFHHLITEGFVKILGQIQLEEWPEIFVMDQRHLANLHNAVQDIIIVECLFKIIKPKNQAANCKAIFMSFKKAVKKLLASEKTTIANLIECCIKHYEAALSVHDAQTASVGSHDKLIVIVDKILYNDSPAFQLVRRRVLDCLRSMLLQKFPSSDLLVKTGLHNHLGDILDIASKLRKIIDLHIKVHHDFYSNLLMEIKPTC